jgi:tetratricopeptide (TPR) repeat protein
VTLDDAVERVTAANLRQDWRGVIKWEGRMDEMMEHAPDAVCNEILEVFCNAHEGAFNLTGSKDNSLSIVRLETRKFEVLGKMQRFRDQGQALCRVADYLLGLGRRQEAEGYFQRARKIAEAHGFFSVECRSCLGLGKLAMTGGRKQEGVELLRNALVCVPLFEEEDTIIELNILLSFTDALFDTYAIDEAEPLVARFLEAAKAESQKQGRLHLSEFYSLYTSARLYEVLCTHPPRVGPPLHCSALAFHQSQ